MLILFVGILITSGCIDNGDDSEANTSPVAVNEFNITPNPVPGGQSTSVYMELENTGDKQINDVYARLFGPTFPTNDPGTWRTSDGGEVSSTDRTLNIGDLETATDTSPAIPGSDRVTLTSPSIDEGKINPYTFNAKLQYQTRTTGSAEIQMMSNERYQEKDVGQTSPPVDTSDGPIQFDVQGTTPHVFYSDGTGNEEICITVRNEGSGTPFLTTTSDGISTEEDTGYDVNEDAKGKVELRVEDVGNVELSSQENGGNSATVELIGSEGYQCFDMELVGLGEVTDLEQTTEIPIEVVYGYEEETSTSVTVEGRPSGSSDPGDADSEDE
ncbi:MAG: hypothetical protein ACLFRK_00445 [Candidatus Nanohaloarchaea archaeon]